MFYWIVWCAITTNGRMTDWMGTEWRVVARVAYDWRARESERSLADGKEKRKQTTTKTTSCNIGLGKNEEHDAAIYSQDIVCYSLQHLPRITHACATRQGWFAHVDTYSAFPTRSVFFSFHFAHRMGMCAHHTAYADASIPIQTQSFTQTHAGDMLNDKTKW